MQNIVSTNKINSIFRITTCLLISLSFPILIVTNYDEIASAQITTEYRKNEGLVLLQEGQLLSHQGKYNEALKKYEKALAIMKEIQDIGWQGAIIDNIGLAYSNLGQYAKALNYYQKALAIAQKIDNKGLKRNILLHFGLVYSNLGQDAKALNYFQKALALDRKINDQLAKGVTLSYIGGAYMNLKKPTLALNYFHQSLEIAIKTNNITSEASNLNSIGIIYMFSGQYDKALEYLEQALDMAIKLDFKAGQGITLYSIASIYNDLKQNEKALIYYRKSLAILREIGAKPQEVNALSNMGSELLRTGNVEEAIKVLWNAIKVQESLREKLTDNDKVSIIDTQINTYEVLQKAYILQNKTEIALEVSERSRTRVLVELIADKLNIDTQRQNKPPNIEEIKQIAKNQNSTLVQYSIITDEFKVKDKQQTKQSELYIWVIKPTGEITFRKADLKPLWQKENTTLDELVTTSRQSIGARGAAFRGIDVSFNLDAPKATDKLKRLHELLINPIADLLPKNPSARVTFIPQSSLFLVPFPALQDKKCKYLIEKHTILTSPSIQVLELTRKQRQQIGQRMGEWQRMGNNMLIVGNPTMPKIPPKIGEARQQLIPLPGAEREAKAIAKLFNTQALIGNQATETKVTQLLPKARLIHLATHGIFDSVSGLNSGIALTPDPFSKGGDKISDGLLTAGEIFDLELNAELVVLSACDTGRGRISGDGVIGLSRSLISAGVPSVLVSLWSVPDAPTAELMKEFYQNLQNNPDKAQALRQAMLKIMKQHPNPRDWAAFTLIGEAE